MMVKSVQSGRRALRTRVWNLNPPRPDAYFEDNVQTRPNLMWAVGYHWVRIKILNSNVLACLSWGSDPLTSGHHIAVIPHRVRAIEHRQVVLKSLPWNSLSYQHWYYFKLIICMCYSPFLYSVCMFILKKEFDKSVPLRVRSVSEILAPRCHLSGSDGLHCHWQSPSPGLEQTD